MRITTFSWFVIRIIFFISLNISKVLLEMESNFASFILHSSLNVRDFLSLFHHHTMKRNKKVKIIGKEIVNVVNKKREDKKEESKNLI
jgi:hypothetical protein